MSYEYKVLDVWQCNAQGLEDRLNEFCKGGLDFEFVVDRFVVFSHHYMTGEEQEALDVAVGARTCPACFRDVVSEDERSGGTTE